MPGKPQIERKLAAIMFTDIAGYTAQMSKDEAVAISLLNKKESILKPLILEHNGTYVKSTGDGSLSHFNSAVDAATCAKRFQESIYDDKELNVRVGVHLGDTIFEKGDIRGDGVNIASRLESMAVAGGVFVSKEVHDQLTNQREFEGVSLGLQSMKGVGRLIEVYGLKGDMLNEPKPSDYQDDKIEKHSDDEVPSIAIIPFDNKGKEEDVFYAYGISADLISDISSAGLIRVASKKDIEKLDYTNLDNTELSQKLLVRYIATGELWKMDEMFQLSIELYDTKASRVVWSDRWQENWDDLTKIKENLSEGLLKAFDKTITINNDKDSNNSEAYEYYLRGNYQYVNRTNKIDIEVAKGLFEKAIEIDNKLWIAHIIIANIYYRDGKIDEALKIYIYIKDNTEDSRNQFYARAIEGIGNIKSYNNNYDLALSYYECSLKINDELNNMPGISFSLNNMGYVFSKKREYKKALDKFDQAIKIKQEIGDNIGVGFGYHAIAHVHLMQWNLDVAINYEKRALKIIDDLDADIGKSYIYSRLGEIYKLMGNFEQAFKFHLLDFKIIENIGEKLHLANASFRMGDIYYIKSEYEKALKYFEQSLKINKLLKKDKNQNISNWLLYPTIDIEVYQMLTKKMLNKKYNTRSIITYLKKENNTKFKLNYRFYELLEEVSYLRTAYNQVQEKASAMEEELKLKFLSYPIPAAIVEEWEKVK